MSGMWERMLDNTAFENGIKSVCGCSLHGMRNSKRNGEIMKKVEHYICDFCGAEYDNKTDCLLCENKHKMPLSIESKRYNAFGQKYPSVLYVKMDDGETIAYMKGQER